MNTIMVNFAQYQDAVKLLEEKKPNLVLDNALDISTETIMNKDEKRNVPI